MTICYEGDSDLAYQGLAVKGKSAKNEKHYEQFVIFIRNHR
jgi:hypothetical protein